MTAPKRSKRLRSLVGWMLSLLLLAGMFWFIPLKEVAGAIGKIHPLWFIGAMGFTGINLMFRGNRWALFFQPRYQVKGTEAWGPVITSLALNCVLPGRVGEIARVMLGAEKLKTSLTFCATTMVGDRFMDMVTLIGMMGVSMLMIPSPENTDPVTIMNMTVDPGMMHGMTIKLALVCLACALVGVCFLIPAIRDRGIRILKLIPLFRHPRVDHFLDEITHGLSGLTNPVRVLKLIFYSLWMWLAIAGTYWMVAKGLPGIEVNWLQALVLTTMTMAFAAVPSAPGAWGVFEAGGMLGLTLLGLDVEPSVGLAYFFAVHATQFIPVVTLGMIAIHREGWRLGSLVTRIKSGAPPQSTTDRHKSETQTDAP